MLFNSLAFLFLFLPPVVAGYYLLRRFAGHGAALFGLVTASLVFYSAWGGGFGVRYAPLLLGSILVNYVLGRLIVTRGAQPWLALGIVLHLGLLGLFKYADFAVANVNAIFGTETPLPGFPLPLAISFFTFQQISLLVDAARRETEPRGLLNHALFVSFFPQLIAGPIVRHAQIAPQYADAARRDRISENLAVGLSIFAIGLAKKVLLADNMEPYAAPFELAARGEAVGLIQAWTGALAYSLQIFFDFSGYSDMAIGLARMFGYHLPINFNAPYRATSVVDFWRRWHITLSRFLRDYLYIPLGGSRHGGRRRAANLMIVMLLGGLWHGAAWTFVAWGALHGLGLAWCHVLNRLRPNGLFPRARWIAVLATFLFVTAAWVLFRAASFDAAGAMFAGMAGFNGLGPGVGDEPFIAIVLGLAIIWGLPDTASIFSNYLRKDDLKLARVETQPGWRWRPGRATAIGLAVLFFVAAINASRVADFIYYSF